MCFIVFFFSTDDTFIREDFLGEFVFDSPRKDSTLYLLGLVPAVFNITVDILSCSAMPVHDIYVSCTLYHIQYAYNFCIRHNDFVELSLLYISNNGNMAFKGTLLLSKIPLDIVKCLFLI